MEKGVIDGTERLRNRERKIKWDDIEKERERD
jgi:hypothetical protein